MKSEEFIQETSSSYTEIKPFWCLRSILALCCMHLLQLFKNLCSTFLNLKPLLIKLEHVIQNLFNTVNQPQQIYRKYLKFLFQNFYNQVSVDFKPLKIAKFSLRFIFQITTKRRRTNNIRFPLFVHCLLSICTFSVLNADKNL